MVSWQSFISLHLKLLDIDHPLTFEESKLRQVEAHALIYLSLLAFNSASKHYNKSNSFQYKLKGSLYCGGGASNHSTYYFFFVSGYRAAITGGASIEVGGF